MTHTSCKRNATFSFDLKTEARNILETNIGTATELEAYY